MLSFESFYEQISILETLPVTGLPPSGLFLLGVVHSRTDISVSTLYPFLQQIANAHDQGWLTPDETLKIDHQLYLGQVGAAHELLAQSLEVWEKMEHQQREIESLPCDLCGQRLLIEADVVVHGQGKHRFHQKCGQRAVRGEMMKGGGTLLRCPARGCSDLLSEDQLQLLFPSEDLSILRSYWRAPRHDSPPIPLLCPTFHCKASTLWHKGQFFGCGKCAVTYCLHCLSTVFGDSRGHVCGPHTIENVEIGEAFAQGGRFKVCEKCGYWCCVAGAKTVICRCGADICSKCVLVRDRCTCNDTVFDKIRSLSHEIKKRL